MYPKNAASPPRIAVGAVVQISDGVVQTSGVSIAVVPQGGASAGGGGTTAYDNGIVLYTPTQAETNYAAFVVIAYKTGCIPVSQTIVTTASAVAGYAGLDWSLINAPTTTQGLSGTTVKTATDVETDTADIQSRLPSALVGGRIDANMGAISTDQTAADNAESFFDGTGYAGTNNVIPAVTNVTGSVGSLAAQAKADVNAEVVDALNVDTYAEPGQEAPGATVSLAKKISYLYKQWRNKKDQSASSHQLYADDGTTVDQKATVSESVGTVTKTEYVAGP